jgi:DNA-binding protein H-NS
MVGYAAVIHSPSSASASAQILINHVFLAECATHFFLLEMKMARTPLASMSVEALLKLRDDVGKVLSQKAVQLEQQLSKLGSEVGGGRRGRGSAMKGRKVPAKYRDKEGNTWAGRGAQPVWLREKLKAGAKLEDFAVQKTAATRKASPRKAKKRRRKK